MEENYTVEDKQNYLRDQIMDQGYDAEQFVSFFSNIKGDDFENELTQISKNELKTIVWNFKSQNKQLLRNGSIISTQSKNIANLMGKQSAQVTKVNTPVEELSPVKIVKKDEEKEEESSFKKLIKNEIVKEEQAQLDLKNKAPKDKTVYKELSDNFYIEEMDSDELLICKKITKSPLFTYEDLNIDILYPEAKKKTVFSSSVSSYPVICNEINSKVLRSFKDFEWLKDILKEQFPGTYVSLILVIIDTCFT